MGVGWFGKNNWITNLICLHNFYLVNYANVDLTNLKELNNVNYCELNLQARNNYPFDAKLQGYMINDQNQIIDSLFTPSNNSIQSAVTDINNNVLNYVDSKLTVNTLPLPYRLL